jgi:hypothetical protein
MAVKPSRPPGDTIDILDPEAVRAWAAWLEVDHNTLRNIVRIVGSSAGQIEYILGKNLRSRW